MALFGWENLKKLGTRPQPPHTEVGTGPATKCEKCGEILIKKILEDNLGVCPHAKCGHHHRISARRRIEITLDPDSFQEMDAALATRDILDFRGPKTYMDKLREAQAETGLVEAAVTGIGRLASRPVAFGVTDSGFIMGSMGSVVGEKITRLCERALAERLPLILVSGSGGGARMYEGLFSLMQMAKTAAALGRLREAGVPFISVCTDCTMAGVWASWASLGDIIIAEPQA
ncbi:MAG: acetyl-CoA carboxylase carboxyl transferase subunit beta, partial [Planctomycetota bacterium]|nr:acetyl-CoA carboxylase carboxyl transferase subunit beta [Planctomycetota bacterium]